MRLWLYSIKCTRIADWSVKDKLKCTLNCDLSDDVFKHNILLFCLDEHGTTHIVRVNDYYTFITLLLKKRDTDRLDKTFNYQSLTEDVNVAMNAQIASKKRLANPNYVHRTRSFVQDVDHKNVRLLVGYTKSAIHTRLRVRLTQESQRYQVSQFLQQKFIDEDGKSNMRIGGIGIEQFLHSNMTPETEFLLEREIDCFSWIEITNYHDDRDMKKLYQKNVVPLVVSQNFVCPLHLHVGQLEPRAPQLLRVYLRVEANSFTATKHNQNNPSYDIPEDCVNCVSICTSRSTNSAPMTFAMSTINDQPTSRCASDTVKIFDSERDLLIALADCITTLNAHVIVLGSDEKCGPSSLFYLTKRAMRYNIQLGFSKLPHLIPRCTRKACGKTGEMIVLDHHGMERADICQILPRAQISPNLDGFTLVDAARHDKLLNKTNKEFFRQIINLDYVGTNSMSYCHDVIADNRMMAMLLRAIENGSNFVLGQQEVARMCTLDLTSVIERGQQARVQNLFYGRYYKRNIVINDEQTKKPYVVVNKLRQDSSYPRPPWLKNPSKDQMRSAKRPGQVIRERLPRHVQFVQDMEHSNIFDIPVEHPNSNSSISSNSSNSSSSSSSSSSDASSDAKVEMSSENDRDVIENLCDLFSADLLKHTQKKTEQRVPKDNDDERSNEPDNVWWKNKRGADFKPKSRKCVKTQAEKDAAISYRGGSVMDAMNDFYRLPEETILTVDFASLYPSIMRAFRICYMRVVYDPSWLERSDVELEYVPITETQCVVFVKRHLINGEWKLVDDITPEIVEDIMQLRDRVRKQQNDVPVDSFDYQILESRQLAAKTIANSTYGFTGSKTSLTPCTALAAAITQIGQWKIHTVRFIFIFFGHMCVYGDTDSNMILFWVPSHLVLKDDIMNWIYKEGKHVVGVNMQVCVPPNKLEMETFKSPYLLLGKKTYAAKHYKVYEGSWNDKSNNVLKGLAAKKRDKCSFAQSIGYTLANRFLNDPMVTFDVLVQWFEGELATIPMGKITTIEQLNPFIITCALNGEYKTEDTKAVKALHLAQMTESHSGARPRVGTRIPYVVTYKPKQKLQAQWCEIPAVFFATGSILNVAYILNNHVLNVVKQILSLPMHEELLHMFERCVQKKITKWNNMQTKTREITHFFKSSSTTTTIHI